MASIDKRPNGQWRARWREFPGGPQKTRQFARKVDAERFLDGIRGDLARGTYVDAKASSVTVAAYARAWMDRQPWRPSTRERTASVVRAQLEPVFGERSIGSIRTSELQAWVTSLRGQLAPTTVEGVFRVLAAILRAAVLDRALPYSPADAVRLPRREGEMVPPLTVAEVETLAEAIVPDLRTAVLFAALTGLRQGELFGLTEDRVRWLRREILVDRQLVTPPTNAPVLGPCKTARSVRVVPLADRALEVLSEHFAAYPAADGFAFHRSGKPWRRNRAADAIRAASKATGLDVGWHRLRHHCASVLIAQGLSVTAVAAVLGHSPAECLQTYAGWWPREDESIRAALSRAWTRSAEDSLRTGETAPQA
jgi:integrase